MTKVISDMTRYDHGQLNMKLLKKDIESQDE